MVAAEPEFANELQALENSDSSVDYHTGMRIEILREPSGVDPRQSMVSNAPEFYDGGLSKNENYDLAGMDDFEYLDFSNFEQRTKNDEESFKSRRSR